MQNTSQITIFGAILKEESDGIHCVRSRQARHTHARTRTRTYTHAHAHTTASAYNRRPNIRSSRPAVNGCLRYEPTNKSTVNSSDVSSAPARHQHGHTSHVTTATATATHRSVRVVQIDDAVPARWHRDRLHSPPDNNGMQRHIHCTNQST